jgi:hypothetical protein
MELLLPRIEAFCAKAGMAETTLGSLAVKDSRFVARLREGRVTLRCCQRVVAWLNDMEKAA